MDEYVLQRSQAVTTELVKAALNPNGVSDDPSSKILRGPVVVSFFLLSLQLRYQSYFH